MPGAKIVNKEPSMETEIKEKKLKEKKPEHESQKKEKKDKKKAPEDTKEEEEAQDKEKKKKEKKEKKHKEDEEEKKEKKRKHEDEENGSQPAKKAKSSSGSGFRKDFYTPHPNVAKATEQQVEEFRSQHGIVVSGNNIEAFKPITKFAESSIDESILKYCQKFSSPSPIQAQCWPIALSGRDLVGIATTGSGKTVAFALPGLVHIRDQKPFSKGSAPIALVLSPTRELAMQITEVFVEAGKTCGVKSVCLYGGVSKFEQKKELHQGVQVVVATPGRLMDLVEEGVCSLQKITYLVLDEADRMLDMGFEKEVKTILSKIPNKDRQTLMFSATWPKAIQELSAQYLNDPVKVTVGSTDLAASHSVKQIVEVVEQSYKETRLEQLLSKYHASRTNRVLIFALYKKEASRLETFLNRRGWKAASIHGDKSQHDRTQALEEFKSGKSPLLIATDVAARGLDIPNVEFVINVTFPLTIEDYVHRIGRTGRAGKKGVSHTLFTSFDKAHAGELVNVLKEAKQEVPEELKNFGTHTKKKEHALYGAHFKDLSNGGGEPPKAQKITFDDDD